jgi:hypothetical protein
MGKQTDNGEMHIQLISVGCTIGMVDGNICPQTVIQNGLLSRPSVKDYVHVLNMDESFLERMSPEDRADVIKVRKHQARYILKGHKIGGYSFTFADGTTSLYAPRLEWLEKIAGVMEVK